MNYQDYFNAGVLVINLLEAIRKNKLVKLFLNEAKKKYKC